MRAAGQPPSVGSGSGASVGSGPGDGVWVGSGLGSGVWVGSGLGSGSGGASATYSVTRDPWSTRWSSVVLVLTTVPGAAVSVSCVSMTGVRPRSCRVCCASSEDMPTRLGTTTCPEARTSETEASGASEVPALGSERRTSPASWPSSSR